jgi:hypothetical protein
LSGPTVRDPDTSPAGVLAPTVEYGGRVPEPRRQFREHLADLEHRALGGLDMVIQALDRALEALTYQDLELAGMVVADDDLIDGRCLDVYQGCCR